MIADDIDITVFVQHIDPDWSDHFATVDQAFDHYRAWSTPKDFHDAVKESGCRCE